MGHECYLGFYRALSSSASLTSHPSRSRPAVLCFPQLELLRRQRRVRHAPPVYSASPRIPLQAPRCHSLRPPAYCDRAIYRLVALQRLHRRFRRRGRQVHGLEGRIRPFNGWGLEHWEPLDFDPALSPASTSPRAASATSSRFHSNASNMLATSTGDHVVQAVGPRLPRSPQGAVRRTWRCHPKPGVQPFWYVPRESRRLAVTA